MRFTRATKFILSAMRSIHCHSRRNVPVSLFLLNSKSVRVKLLRIAFPSFSYSFSSSFAFSFFLFLVFPVYILSSACNYLLSQLVIYFIFNLFSFSFPILFCIACYFLIFYFIFIFIFLFSCL